MILYGFWSNQHFKGRSYDSWPGYAVYTTPSGLNVCVTAVDEDLKAPEYLWSDKLFLGQVLEYIRGSIPKDFGGK